MAPSIMLQKLISVDGGITFVPAVAPPGPTLVSPTNPEFRYVVTNMGDVTLTSVTLTDTGLGSIALSATTLAPGASTEAFMMGSFAIGPQMNGAQAIGVGGGQTVTACAVANFVGVAAGPSITIRKLVSVDGGTTFAPAPAPPGPALFSPMNPRFQYVVTNNGSVPLTLVAVNDSKLGPITLGGNLAPGESLTAGAEGTFAAGQRSNQGTATGIGNGQQVTASSIAFFTGIQALPTVTIEKLVSVDNGATFQPAPVAPGPTLNPPTNPIFRYIVTNNGTVPLSQVVVTDSVLGNIPFVGALGPDESFAADKTGTFAEGLHANTGTVTAVGNGQQVTASATAFFTGASGPSFIFQKLVSVDNGATFAPTTGSGPTLISPMKPQFRFVVINNGTEALLNLHLTDTTFGALTIPATLLPGESFTTTLTGTFSAGTHCNTATLTATVEAGVLSFAQTACFTGVFSAVPVFPNISNPAPQNQIIDRLLETVALEELALAAVVNAEAEKVQAVVAAGVRGPVDVEDIQAINASVMGVVQRAAEKERTLRRKLQTVLAHKATFPTQCPPVCTSCPPDCCPAPCPPATCPPTP